MPELKKLLCVLGSVTFTGFLMGPAVFPGQIKPVEDFSDISEWSDLTSEKKARGETSEASFTTDCETATLTCDADEGYAYILSNLWVDTDNFKGIIVKVSSLSENATWAIRFNWLEPPAYSGEDIAHVYVPFPEEIANTGHQVSVLFMLIVGNKKPGTEPPSVSFDEIYPSSGPLRPPKKGSTKKVTEEKKNLADQKKKDNAAEARSPISNEILEGLKRYRVRAEDILSISVSGEPDFSRDHVWVYPEPEGLIKYAPLGDIRVVGLTILEIEEKLEKLLNQYVDNPEVSVSVREYHSELIFVLGAVKKPGTFDCPSGVKISAMRAIEMAGGFNEYADENSIKIITGAAKKMHVTDINNHEATERVILKPGDIIFVPDKTIVGTDS